MPIGWRRSEASAAALALGAALAFGSLAAEATVDANRASLAELEAVTGVGPALAAEIVAARDRSPFADWADLLRRVKGIGAARAARLSAAGLTVGGAAWSAPRAAPSASER